METLMLTSTVIDLLAVAVLAWLVFRSGREHDAALGVQRAALEGLRADLAELVLEAEQRTQGLARALDAREERLRALLDDLARAEARPSAVEPQPAAPAAEREADDLREAARRLGVDPAEARLLRDLQLHVEPRRA
jgi:hypothetical protein